MERGSRAVNSSGRVNLKIAGSNLDRLTITGRPETWMMALQQGYLAGSNFSDLSMFAIFGDCLVSQIPSRAPMARSLFDFGESANKSALKTPRMFSF